FIVGGRLVVTSLLNLARSSPGFVLPAVSPIDDLDSSSGISGIVMCNTTSPPPSASRKISCSMVKHPEAIRHKIASKPKPATRLAFHLETHVLFIFSSIHPFWTEMGRRFGDDSFRLT